MGQESAARKRNISRIVDQNDTGGNLQLVEQIAATVQVNCADVVDDHGGAFRLLVIHQGDNERGDVVAHSHCQVEA